jgi:hypothetical protein
MRTKSVAKCAGELVNGQPELKKNRKMKLKLLPSARLA